MDQHINSNFIRTSIIIPLLFVAFPSMSNDKLDELVELSGLKPQLEYTSDLFNQSLQAGISQQGGQVPQEMADYMINLSKEVFVSEPIISDLKSRLVNHASDKGLQKHLEWYRSDLGEKIVEYEIKYSNPEYSDQYMADQKLTEKRKKQIDQFIDITKSIETTIDSSINLQLAMINAQDKVHDIPNISQIRDMVRSSRDMLRPQTEQYLQGYYGVVYQELSDQELQKYIYFLGEDEANSFLLLVSDALNELMNEKFKDYSRKFAEYSASSPSFQKGRQSSSDKPGPPM